MSKTLCPECKKDFIRTADLGKHLRRYHADLYDDEAIFLTIHPNESLICPICGNKRKGCGNKYLKTCGSKECDHLNRVLNNVMNDPERKHLAQEGLYKHQIEKYGSWENAIKIRNEKTIKTNLRKYGKEHPFVYGSNEYKENLLKKYDRYNIGQFGTQEHINSIINKYGSIENMYDKIQAKIKQTCLTKYGTTNMFTSEYFKEKAKETCLERYGVTNYGQSELAQKNRFKNYVQNGIFFDSLPELDFYNYCILNKIHIERNYDYLEYIYEDKVHRYYPDFKLNGMYIELKGKHLQKDGKWINPFDDKDNGLYEAKWKCAIDNKVVIIYVDAGLNNDWQKLIANLL